MSVFDQVTEQEAIATALGAVWPKAQPAAEQETSNTLWRFSGHWWRDSSVIRRSRQGL